ncbi:aminodeoxychorismate synthase, component I [Rhodothalassium salexigens]|nr:aminodeoxychorismate synthase, component I [Rhodothalassium salexigens]MBK5921545.1 aminodeoxychorismate synthase, component I [Rhodothalassium salexigens]
MAAGSFSAACNRVRPIMPLSLRRPPCLLLDDSRRERGLLFADPVEIIQADRLDAVVPALERLDAVLADGCHAAGWIGYEAAAAFEPRVAAATRGLPPEPLVWLLVVRRPQPLAGHDLYRHLAEARGGTARHGALIGPDPTDFAAWYAAGFTGVMERIAAGEVYQANLTFAPSVRATGDPLAIYQALRRAQPTPYSAYIDTGAWRVLSLSPELFVSIRGGDMTVRPMKGTAPRRPWGAWDDAAAAALAADPKARAENLMIVDLMRNDLSRVAVDGSVQVARLFDVERYPSVLQLTSTVRAQRRPGLAASALLGALFPCGSVTGAPKIRAMETIAMLEAGPRGIYTGAIGHFAPNGDLALNVAIRTAIVDRQGRGRFGLGSGLVADSDRGEEWRECALKAAFTHRAGPTAERDEAQDFALIETMVWTPADGIALLDGHMARLRASAHHLGFACDGAAVHAAISDALTAALGPAAGACGGAVSVSDGGSAQRSMTGSAEGRVWAGVKGGAGTGRHKVRLLLARDGVATVTVEALGDDPLWRQPRVVFADQPQRSDNLFLYHKTTRRAHYDVPLQRAQARENVTDVLFLNERGHLTEGALSNLFVAIGGRLITPPREAGLLGGVLRQMLLTRERKPAVEAPLTAADLARAEAVYIGNAVHGLRPVKTLQKS